MWRSQLDGNCTVANGTVPGYFDAYTDFAVRCPADVLRCACVMPSTGRYGVDAAMRLVAVGLAARVAKVAGRGAVAATGECLWAGFLGAWALATCCACRGRCACAKCSRGVKPLPAGLAAGIYIVLAGVGYAFTQNWL